ncbi:MAG: L-rhamnose mutarotase [Bacteroidales bacterium]|nr:L-rhamnose mutarotase [Bacteroidales bacterium]
MRIIQTLKLKDDPELIAKYRDVHRNVWPEVKEGIGEVGITNMEIFINGNTLFMIVDTVEGFDRERDFARLAQLPRQAEWEAFVARFQDADPGASSGEKWMEAEKIFSLTEDDEKQ